MACEAAGDRFRRLVVVQQTFHEHAELLVRRDSHALVAGVFPARVCLVIRFLGIVLAVDAVSFDLLQDAGMAAVEMPRNASGRISLRTQGTNVKPLAAGDFRMTPIIFFITQS